MHATFLLIVAWVVLNYRSQGESLANTALGVLFVLALFACVVLHELGHALAAQHYGIKTRDITLLPIGGVARLERMPDVPIQEFWVALAGPAVTLVIAAVLYIALHLIGSFVPISDLNMTNGSFVERLMMVNVFLLLFNILPAFPMDGGRVLRALLATRMEYTRATQIAAALGQGMALLFGFAGFFGNPFLLFIALFVWIGAEQEASMAQMKSALGGIPVRRAMLTEFHAVTPEDRLEHIVELILSGSQHDFPVVENGRAIGVITRSDLVSALSKNRDQTVGQVMQREFQTAHSSEMLESAFRRLQESSGHIMPVLQSDKLVGLLTAENVGEFLMIQAALDKARTQHPRPSTAAVSQ
jgi:Zn-dependent protease/CBS domain-containing protein